MDSDDDDGDLDFDAFFDEDDMEEITSVSANLIVACGLGDGSESVVHKGDVDEGKIMWIAPEFAGLDNSSAGGLNHWGNKKQTWSRDGATDEFFDEIDETAVPEELPEIERQVPQRNKPQMSESILQALDEEVRGALETIRGDRPEQIEVTASLVSRLAEHGKGGHRMAMDELKELRQQISEDGNAKALLKAVKHAVRSGGTSKRILIPPQ